MILTPCISSGGPETLSNSPKATQHASAAQKVHLALLAPKASAFGHE